MKSFKKLFKTRLGLVVVILGLFLGVGLLLAQTQIPPAPSAPLTPLPLAPSAPSVTIPPPPGEAGIIVSDPCVPAGGTDVGGVCRFSLSRCPFGWTQDRNWSTTQANTCNGEEVFRCFGATSCTTGSHVWGNTALETCTFDNEFRGAAFNDEDRSAADSLLAVIGPFPETGSELRLARTVDDPGPDPSPDPKLECTTQQRTCFALVTQIGCNKT